MSHSTVVVARKPGEPELDTLLAPFDENLAVEPYWRHEADNPAGHWAYDGLLKKGRITEQIDAEAYLAALRAEFPGSFASMRVGELGQLEERSTYNPRSRWDWWALGGRWSGYFLMRDGNRANAGPKSEIDFEGMRAEAAEQAAERFDELASALASYGLRLEENPGTWDAFLHRTLPERFRGMSATDLGEADRKLFHEEVRYARARYHEHPFNQALAKAEIMPFLSDPVEDFFLDRDDPRAAYLAEAVEEAGVPHAFLVDGQWHEVGRMGWFGISHDDQPVALWRSQVRELYAGLPDDAHLYLVDVHI